MDPCVIVPVLCRSAKSRVFAFPHFRLPLDAKDQRRSKGVRVQHRVAVPYRPHEASEVAEEEASLALEFGARGVYLQA